MGRVPGSVVAAAAAVEMTDHGLAGATRCPIVAGAVVTGRQCISDRVRAGQDVMFVLWFTVGTETTRNLIAVLVRAGFGDDVIGVAIGIAMQIVEIGCDHDAIGVVPRAITDAIARVRRLRALGA